MKKIGIITVYYTENVGSVLQAMALKDFLVQIGYEVYFISTKNKYSAHSLKYLLKSVLKALRMHIDYKQCISRYLYFENYIKQTFSVVNYKSISTIGIDKLIIGSDTVWDINSKYFCKSKDLFFGIKMNANLPIISYAVSMGNSNFDSPKQLSYVSKALNRFKAIGVRDNFTKQNIKNIVNKTISLNCDPTLLFDTKYYQKYCFLIQDRYILLYLFEDISEGFKDKLKQFAALNNLKLICLGKYIDGCDLWIQSTVENFISYFNSAEHVVTNTFHGSVFSILFNKNFIALDYNKMKVKEILANFGLLNRLTKDDVELLKTEINFDIVNHIMIQQREESKGFLIHAISEEDI